MAQGGGAKQPLPLGTIPLLTIENFFKQVKQITFFKAIFPFSGMSMVRVYERHRFVQQYLED
jgi:hypothetical protein